MGRYIARSIGIGATDVTMQRSQIMGELSSLAGAVRLDEVSKVAMEYDEKIQKWILKV